MGKCFLCLRLLYACSHWDFPAPVVVLCLILHDKCEPILGKRQTISYCNSFYLNYWLSVQGYTYYRCIRAHKEPLLMSFTYNGYPTRMREIVF